MFFLRELLHSARAQANTLHVTAVHPASRRVRWSAVFIAGGASLIASRYYKTGDFHERREIIGELRRRFPDLVTTNFDLVPVHPSMLDIDIVANFARQRFVLVAFDEEREDDYLVSVVLKLDLLRCHLAQAPLAQVAVSVQARVGLGFIRLQGKGTCQSVMVASTSTCTCKKVPICMMSVLDEIIKFQGQ